MMVLLAHHVLGSNGGRHATVGCSQLPVEHWHKWLCDPTVADAILDRLVHRSYRLMLTDPSRREEWMTPQPGR